MNIFDGAKRVMFDTVTNTMGYTASWTPSDNSGPTQIGKVLYKGPTEKEKLLDANYDPDKLTIEYKDSVFIGLKEAVDSSNSEMIRLSGLAESEVEFVVRSVRRIFDGHTFEASVSFNGL